MNTPHLSFKVHPPILAPSLLAADHGAFAQAAEQVASQGLKWLHLDIMDGHFVPNLSFGSAVLTSLRKKTDLFFDTHLMLSEPHRYVQQFIDAGADLISIHVEPDYPLLDTLKKIRTSGCQCGIALNPDTPTQDIIETLDLVDLVLVMTVQPGFGGQAFRPEVLPKIKELDQLRKAHNYGYRIEVDGGINAETAVLCAQNGADTFVIGQAFFGCENPEKLIHAIHHRSV